MSQSAEKLDDRMLNELVTEQLMARVCEIDTEALKAYRNNGKAIEGKHWFWASNNRIMWDRIVFANSGIYTNNDELLELDQLLSFNPSRKIKDSNKKLHELYRYFDSNDTLLYVGISYSAVARAAQHKSNSHWYARVARIEISRARTRDDLIKAEVLAIKLESPKFNKTHNGGLH